jgi:uracil-DNA glycosylase family 4
MASDPRALEVLAAEIVACRRCPRLVAHREAVAREKKREFRDDDYWGRPLPGYGDPAARLLVVGLAPAAHGGNRTGRVFTGDSSGLFLFRALHQAGFASQPSSRGRDDGLVLHDAWVNVAVRCAPPDNKPLPAERAACAPWLAAEVRLLPRIRVVVALGKIAWDAVLRLAPEVGWTPPTRPKPAFAHLAEASLGGARGDLRLIGSYHPSRQNTNTGRLTAEMLGRVFGLARAALR